MQYTLGSIVWYMDCNKAVEGFVHSIYGKISEEDGVRVVEPDDYTVCPLVGPIENLRIHPNLLFKTKEELLKSL